MNPVLKRAALRLAGVVLLCSVGLSGFGLPTDPQQELNLQFDSSNLDLRKGITVYRGNVKLTQGSLRIESDELVVHSDDEEIQKVVATGSPAVFEQQPEVDQMPVIATGKRIEYDLQAQVETVAVIDNAVLEQGGVVSRCERIEYNLTDSTAKMMGSCVTERPAIRSDDDSSSPANGS